MASTTQLSTEERMQLAIQAIDDGYASSLRSIATNYGVPHTSLYYRYTGRSTRNQMASNQRKLTKAEETILKQWILSMDDRGMGPTIDYTRCMANLLLEQRGGQPVGLNWVRRYVSRHSALTARYSRRYDYKRALCEDPEAIYT